VFVELGNDNLAGKRAPAGGERPRDGPERLRVAFARPDEDGIERHLLVGDPYSESFGLLDTDRRKYVVVGAECGGSSVTDEQGDGHG
jgi:hypothetical protein